MDHAILILIAIVAVMLLCGLIYRFRKVIGLAILACAAIVGAAAFAAMVPPIVSLLAADAVLIAVATWLCLKPTGEPEDCASVQRPYQTRH